MATKSILILNTMIVFDEDDYNYVPGSENGIAYFTITRKTGNVPIANSYPGGMIYFDEPPTGTPEVYGQLTIITLP